MKTTIQKRAEKVDETTGYVIPDNYFEKLSEEIGSKTYSDNRSNRRNIHRRIYMAAASIAVLIGASILLYVASNIPVTNEPKAVYAKNDDTAKNAVHIVMPAESSKAPEISDAKEENIDNAIIEVAEEMDLTDEELVEFAELLEI